MKPELLAPAGDLERLKVALLYGADAVYLGGNLFGLRANAINFSMQQMQEGVLFAHERGKKVYVTVNIVLHNKEIPAIQNYLEQLEKIGVDGIIVSDPAIMSLALKHTHLPVHVSTQQSTLNYEAVQFYKDLGASRIVLGREVSEEEIRQIKEHVDIELEIFIHGAMCAGFSGRCVLSNYFTNRDANRGGCSQICRWDFNLYQEEKLLQGEKNFTFCSKDLSLLKYIPNIIDLKVDSLKIEGRMRSIYYLATVITIYRKAIDEYVKTGKKYDLEYEKILNQVANRDSIVQFFDGNYDENCSYYNNRIEVSNQDFLGVVLEYDDDLKMAKIEQRNYFKVGDTVSFFGPNHTFTQKIERIYTEEEESIQVVNHPKQIVYIPVKEALSPYDFMRILEKS